jgi:GNAT superfamily N-acetyltransferase
VSHGSAKVPLMDTDRAAPLRVDDEDALVALHRRAAPHEHPHLIEIALHRLARGQGHGLVARREGCVVGFVIGSRTDNGEVTLIGPVVAPEDRRRGTGTRLLAALLDGYGTRSCRLAVDARDRDARRRCRQHGLRPTGQLGQRLEFAGRWHPPPLGATPRRRDDDVDLCLLSVEPRADGRRRDDGRRREVG